MASGFFMGGLAKTLQAQLTENDADNYRKGLLQIDQQRLQNQQENEMYSRAHEAASDLLKSSREFVDAYKIAHEKDDPASVTKTLTQATFGQKQQLMRLYQSMKLDPAIIDAQFASMIATPPASQTEAAMARTKASATGELQQRQAEAAKNVASTRVLNQAADTNAASVDNVNPDLDRSTQLGGEQRGDNFLHSLPGARGLNAKGLYDGTTPITAFSTRTGKNNTKSQRQQAVEDAEIYGQLIGKPFDINRAANLKISETAPAKADASTLTQLTQTRQGLSAFEDTAKENIKVLLDLAKKVPDTGAPILNRPIRALAKDALGNPDVGAFNFQLQSVKNELARIITNPRLVGQLTDNARTEINAALDDGATVGMIMKAYQAAVKDFQNRSAGLDKSIQEVKDRLAGKSSNKTEQDDPLGIR